MSKTGEFECWVEWSQHMNKVIEKHTGGIETFLDENGNLSQTYQKLKEAFVAGFVSGTRSLDV